MQNFHIIVMMINYELLKFQQITKKTLLYQTQKTFKDQFGFQKFSTPGKNADFSFFPRTIIGDLLLLSSI